MDIEASGGVSKVSVFSLLSLLRLSAHRLCPLRFLAMISPIGSDPYGRLTLIWPLFLGLLLLF